MPSVDSYQEDKRSRTLTPGRGDIPVHTVKLMAPETQVRCPSRSVMITNLS